LLLLGADEEVADNVVQDVEGLRLTIEEIPFDARPGVVAEVMDQANVVLMPSQTEGYGLAAVEAIEREIPTLVSSTSGVAMQAAMDGDLAAAWAGWILKVDTTDSGYRTWAKELLTIYRDPKRAIEQAAAIKRELFSRRSWDRTTSVLLHEWLGEN
jgi:glycosyltransferase involved in cell wall biosynthesis